MSGRYLRTLLISSAQILQTIESEYKALRPDRMRLLHLQKTRLAISERMQRIIVQPDTGHQLQRVCAGRTAAHYLNPPPNSGEQLWL